MDTEAAFGANVVTTLDVELRAATVTFVLDAFDVHLIVESILRYLHEKIVVNFQTDVIRRHKCLFSPTAPHSVVKDKKTARTWANRYRPKKRYHNKRIAP